VVVEPEYKNLPPEMKESGYSVCMATGDSPWAGWPGLIPGRGKIFLISILPRGKADHLPPSSAKAKNGTAIPHSLICLHGIMLNYLSTGTLPLPAIRSDAKVVLSTSNPHNLSPQDPS
jgi:hypothetical protein